MSMMTALFFSPAFAAAPPLSTVDAAFAVAFL